MKCKFILFYVFVVFGLNGLLAKDACKYMYDFNNFLLLNNPDHQIIGWHIYDNFANLMIQPKLNQYKLGTTDGFDNRTNNDYSAPNKDALYNLSDHQPVIEFKGRNIAYHTLRLKQNISLTPNQTSVVYDIMGNLIKTINTNNSIYNNEDIVLLANSFNNIVIPQLSRNH